MIQVPTAEPIRDEPIIAIDTTDIVIVEPEPVIVDQDGRNVRASPGSPGLLCPGRATLAEDIVPPSQIINKCANPCVICGICSVCILTILCFSIPV